MLVSVLIATRNRPEDLRRCLESVARQRYRDMEVLILDDASSPAPDKAAFRDAVAGRPVQWLRTDTRLGPIGCRNTLMQHARGDLFFVLDDDASFAGADGIDQAVRAFRAHPEVGILAFKLVERGRDAERLLVPQGRRRIRRQPHLAEQPGYVSHYLAGGHALRRSVIDRAGFFPDDLCYGHEELDLSYRALEAGFKIFYVPGVVIYHDPGVASPAARRWKLYYSLRNRILVVYRHLPWRYAPVHLGGWLLWYALEALREGACGAYARGLRDGLAALHHHDRKPIRPQTVAYLKAHGGRLWW